MDEKTKDNQRVFELLFKLGQAYLEKGLYDEAIEKFSKLIDLGEENKDTYANLSKAYMLKEQYDEKAIEVFNKTLEFEPDNQALTILLSQLNLANKNYDDRAYRIYKKALRYRSQNANDLILTLIKIDYKNGNYESAKSLVDETLALEPNNEELISFYSYMAWKKKAYNEVAKTLKKTLGKKRNPISLRWLILNYIEAVKDAGITKNEYKIKYEDIDYCNHYLKSLNQLNRLNDIYVYLSVKNILQNSVTDDMITGNHSIAEYELFLSDESFSNIWDRGLNKQSSINTLFNFPREIWKKIEPQNNRYTAEPDANLNSNKVITDEEFNQCKTLMLIQINNYNELVQKTGFNELFAKLDNLINKTFDKSAILSLKRTNDGYFIFWKEPLKAVGGANNFFTSFDNLFNDKQSGIKFNCQIIIHQKYSTKAQDLFNNLTTLFEIQQLNSPINTFFNADIDMSNKICITESLYKLIKSDNSINTIFLETITIPTLDKSVSLYEILWEDSLEKLRTGIIKKINRFQILNEIYLNDVFDSFKAVDTFLDRLVIIKVLRPDFRTLKRTRQKEDFFENARKIGKLNHKNIAIIYDISEDEGFSYIAREYLEGTHLTSPMTGSKTVDWRKAIDFCLQIGAGLNYAHNMGIIHTRIKPSNIFISENNEIKITDFAIPEFSTTIKKQQSTNLKNISYASPEQVSNKEIDFRSDIYSVGVVLFELLTRDNPFYNKDKQKLINKIINNKPPLVTSKNQYIPKEIDPIIAKALAKQPKDRYENFEQFMTELQNFLKKIKL